jgi:uncharacterized membrane protein YfcA
MVLAAVGTGLLIGLSLGALGGGGSILTVPALVYLLGQSPHQATTTSLLIVGTAAVAGAASHARTGRVRLREGAIFGALGIAGSYVGSLASAAVPADMLLAGFGALMLAVAVLMTARRRAAPASVPEPPISDPEAEPDCGSAMPQPGTGTLRLASRPARLHLSPAQPVQVGRHPLVIAAAAAGVGLITGFFGVGGGFVIVPALVLFLRFDMASAVATSLVVIAIDSAAAVAVRAVHGGLALNWMVTGVFAAAAIGGALAGGRLAGRAGPQRLSTAFTILVAGVAVYTLARSLPSLA